MTSPTDNSIEHRQMLLDAWVEKRRQIDHNHDHARGGPTSNDNLAHLCVGHHALKHPEVDDRYRWTARQLPGGDIEWTSPLGRVYNDAVPRRVMFV
jgi:hypothetical protein